MRTSLAYLLSAIVWFTASTMGSHVHSMQLAVSPPEPSKEVTSIFALKHLDANTALHIFLSLYNSDARLNVEPQSNSLVFRGSESDLGYLRHLLEELEDRASQAKPPVPAGSLALSIEAKAGGQPVAELRQQYRNLDQQCLALAEQLRSKKEVDKQSKQSLNELVERVFEARQQLQRAEIAENVRRLLKIQLTIETREGLKTQIVQRRVEELLNPDVDWQKKESVGENRAVAAAPQQDRLLDPRRQGSSVGQPSQAANANPLTAIDLLQTSPLQMRDLLRERAEIVIATRKRIENARAKIKVDGNKESQISNLQNAELTNTESNLKYFESQFQFAKLQYDETIKYLSVAVDSVKQQLATAQQEYERAKTLFDRGLEGQSVVTSASVRPRELQVELQRMESLLKLYRAAGDMPEMSEIRNTPDAK